MRRKRGGSSTVCTDMKFRRCSGRRSCPVCRRAACSRSRRGSSSSASARMRFRSASYWDIEGTFETEGGGFAAQLVSLDGARLATGKDFDEAGAPKTADVARLDEQAARDLAASLQGSDFSVRTVEEKP